MKTWVKENIYAIIGNFFIWAVPLIMLIVLAIDTKTTQTKVELWLVVAFIIYFLIYLMSIKKKLGKVAEIQVVRDGYTHWWVWLVRLISILVPFACVFLLTNKIRECANNQTHEIELFIIVTMVSVVIGYLFLIADSKIKEKKKVENN